MPWQQKYYRRIRVVTLNVIIILTHWELLFMLLSPKGELPSKWTKDDAGTWICSMIHQGGAAPCTSVVCGSFEWCHTRDKAPSEKCCVGSFAARIALEVQSLTCPWCANFVIESIIDPFPRNLNVPQQRGGCDGGRARPEKSGCAVTNVNAFFWHLIRLTFTMFYDFCRSTRTVGQISFGWGISKMLLDGSFEHLSRFPFVETRESPYRQKPFLQEGIPVALTFRPRSLFNRSARAQASVSSRFSQLDTLDRPTTFSLWGMLYYWTDINSYW